MRNVSFLMYRKAHFDSSGTWKWQHKTIFLQLKMFPYMAYHNVCLFVLYLHTVLHLLNSSLLDISKEKHMQVLINTVDIFRRLCKHLAMHKSYFVVWKHFEMFLLMSMKCSCWSSWNVYVVILEFARAFSIDFNLYVLMGAAIGMLLTRDFWSHSLLRMWTACYCAWSCKCNYNIFVLMYSHQHIWLYSK